MVTSLLIFIVAALSGVTASIAGFGIGSLLTPLLASQLGMSLAVAAVSIPHALATAVRCWRLRREIDSRVLRSFGVWSAAGGIAGALLYARASNHALTLVLGALLVATGIAGTTAWASRVHPTPRVATVLGVLSGFFGGIAGNQGGLRAAALMTFDLRPLAFVATSTAVGLAIDAARMPFYLFRAGPALAGATTPILVATVGVLVGTVIGERVLIRMNAQLFRRVVSVLIAALGIWLLSTAL
jgi:uncharacterized membrane protein YfcA